MNRFYIHRLGVGVRCCVALRVESFALCLLIAKMSVAVIRGRGWAGKSIAVTAGIKTKVSASTLHWRRLRWEGSLRWLTSTPTPPFDTLVTGLGEGGTDTLYVLCVSEV